MGKMSSAILLSIFLLILELGICCLARKTTFSCIEGERKALLRLKASLFDHSNRLSSWNWKNKNCCAWQGVKCNKITRHVIRLDLSDSKTTIDNYMLQSKMVDSSLLKLKYLSYLDLSGIDFQGSKIPAFLGSMKQLQHLDLSNANFGGIVPHHLGNLSSLRTLDLSGIGSLIVDDFVWAINLSSLEYLDMSNVFLSPTKHMVKVLQMLPSLVVLRLSHIYLDNINLPHACVNSTLLTNVQYLDLSSNLLDGEFPCFFPNMTSLRFLDLSENMYNFSGTHLLRLKNLVDINLASNKLHHKADWISEFLWDRCHLRSLNLGGNHLYGDISEPFKNLSGCWGVIIFMGTSQSPLKTYQDAGVNLESLTLGNNEFYGHLPEGLGELKQLTYLDFSGNFVNGPIPTSLGKLSALTVRYFF